MLGGMLVVEVGFVNLFLFVESEGWEDFGEGLYEFV